MLLAKVAMKTGHLLPTLALDDVLNGQLTEKYKEYGYSAFTLQDYTFHDSSDVKVPPSEGPEYGLDESHSKETPLTISEEADHLATKYHTVSLNNPDNKTYKVLIKRATSNDKIKMIAMVVDPNNQVISKTDVEPGSDYVEIPNFDGKQADQFLVLAASNGAWGTDAFENNAGAYHFYLALELNEPDAVSINIIPDNKLYTYGGNNGGKFRTVEVTVRDTEGNPMPEALQFMYGLLPKGV